MRLSKKQLTPEEKIKIARKEQDRALKKRKKLNEKYPFLSLCKDNDEVKELNKRIARAIADENFARELAIETAKHPKPAPQKLDQSRHTTIKVGDIGSNNKKGINDNPVFSGNQIGKGQKETTAAPTEHKKKSKVKLIFFIVVAVLVIAGTAALSSYITSCVYKSKENSSCTYSVQTI